MSLALLGLGLGWNFSYVAATTELVSLSSPSERGRLVGFSDSSRAPWPRASRSLGGLVYTGGGVVPLAISAAALAALPALWLAARPLAAPLPAPSRGLSGVSLQSRVGGRLSASFL